MVKENIRKLLISILIVLFLLLICASVDYATDDTINNIENTTAEIQDKQLEVVNDTTLVNANDSASLIQGKDTDKIYTTKAKKQKKPTITMTGKPSCSCGRYYKYTWYTRTYVDYCPHCHKYGVLYNAHKWQSRYEQEITCKRCGADYCINCGHEKYSWSHYYLTRC